MKLQKLLILALVLFSLIPVYFINRWLQKMVLPRRSFARLMLYLLLGFALVFFYTLGIVSLILNLFQPAKR